MVEGDLQGVVVHLSHSTDTGSETQDGHSHAQNHRQQLIHLRTTVKMCVTLHPADVNSRETSAELAYGGKLRTALKFLDSQPGDFGALGPYTRPEYLLLNRIQVRSCRLNALLRLLG